MTDVGPGLVTGPWEDPARFEVAADDLSSPAGGGEGLVFRAIDHRSGSQVALKLLTDATLEFAEISRRARPFSELEHPNLMRQILVFQGAALSPEPVADRAEYDITYVASEWIEGSSLSEVAASFDGPAIFRCLRDVAEGLTALHGHRSADAPAGLVHRDIKPSNIRITTGGDAVIIDYGIARPIDPDDMTKGAGTYQWRAPEVIAGRGDAPASADAWGLGALAYWLYTRRAPPGDPATAVEELSAADAAQHVRHPPALAAHVAQLLQSSPRHRPTDLVRWAKGLPHVATVRPQTRRVAAGLALAAALITASVIAYVERGDGTRIPTGAASTSTSPSTTDELPTTTQPPDPPRASELVARAESTDNPYEALFWFGESIAATDDGDAPDYTGWASAVSDLTVRPYSLERVSDLHVTHQSWSPDGELAFFVTDDTAGIFERSGRKVSDLPAVSVTSSAWSADGKVLAIATAGGGASLFDRDGQRSGTWSPPDESSAVGTRLIWNPTHQLVALITAGGIEVIDGRARAIWSELESRSCDDFAWSPDGTRALAVCDGRSTAVLLGDEGQELDEFAGDPDSMFFPAWSPDSRSVGVVSLAGTMAVFDVAFDELRLAGTPTMGGFVSAVHWAPSAEITTVGDTQAGVIWPEAGIRFLADMGESISASALSPAGDQLGVASRSGSVSVATIDGSASSEVFRSGDRSVRDLRWSPNGSWLAVLNDDGTVNVQSSDLTMPPTTITDERANSIAWIDDDELSLAAATADLAVRLTPADGSTSVGTAFSPYGELAWRPSSSVLAFGDGTDIAILSEPPDAADAVRVPIGEGSALDELVWSPTGDHLLAWWEATSGYEAAVLEPSGAIVNRLILSTRPSAAAFAGDVGLVLETSGRLHLIGPVPADVRAIDVASSGWEIGQMLAVDPQEQRVAVVSDRNVDIVDVSSASVVEHLSLPVGALAAGYGPDSVLAIALDEGTIWLRGPGDEAAVVSGSSGAADGLAWSGRRVATYGLVGTFGVIDVDADPAYRFTAPGCALSTQEISWAHDGSMIAAVCGGDVSVFTVDGQLIGSYGASLATSIAFSPTDSVLAVGAADGFVQLIDPEGRPLGRPLRVGDGEVWHVRWSTDGRALAASVPFGEVKVWRTWTIGELCAAVDAALPAQFFEDAREYLGRDPACHTGDLRVPNLPMKA